VSSPTPRDEWNFGTAHVGRRVLVFDELPSTNTHASEHDAEGDAIVALHQTAGRGQYDRVWQSRPGSSLLLSVVLSPPPELRRPCLLTAWAAVGVSHAIETLTDLRPEIKWPNDLLVGGKKICGILIEQRARTVVGIGLNLSQTGADFASAGLPDATSLFAAAGAVVEVQDAADQVLSHLDADYGFLLDGDREWVEDAWKERFELLGQTVLIELTDGTSFPARVRDISFDGLEIETADGYPRAIVPETVAHIRAL
jgi:BirA family biotin operon repressor/biotin-[acetyl-CoA-carboxylase] ligase